MTTTDLSTLPDLAKLLANDGWCIFEYKVIASNTVTLTIIQKEKEGANEKQGERVFA